MNIRHISASALRMSAALLFFFLLDNRTAIAVLSHSNSPFMVAVTPSLQIDRISVASDGTQGNDASGIFWAYISDNGQFTAFASRASNLIPNDTNNMDDFFVYDTQDRQTECVSVASDGTQGNSVSVNAVTISGDGRYVVFSSFASNLIANDTNGEHDVFLRDRQTGETQIASIASDGTQGNAPSGFSTVSVSTDGRYVAFYSTASNLVSDDTNGQADVFVRDEQTEQTQRVSVASDGMQGNNTSTLDHLSSDGRYVVFSSTASNLVPGDTNGTGDVFVRDIQTGQVTRVSITSDGSQANGPSWAGTISADGRYIAFESSASDLVQGDTNGKDDVFVHDRQTGQTTRVSVASDGSQANGANHDGCGSTASISGDGRFVVFTSAASNLVPADTNGTTDIFVHDMQTAQTIRVSIASDGSQANARSGGCRRPTIASDGTSIAFVSDASNLVPGDTNEKSDVFVATILAWSTYSVSGSITDGNNSPIPDVSVSDTAGHTTRSDGSGNYTLTGLPAGVYTITPSKSEWTFTPTSRTVTVPPEAVEQDFTGIPADMTAPASIMDLIATTGTNAGEVDLRWTAPGDDGSIGTATAYVVRYADSPIVSEFGWLAATDVDGEPVPQPAGSAENMTVSRLAPGETYYFAIKTEDEVPNTSNLSNSPSAVAKEAVDLGFVVNRDGYHFSNPGTAAPRPDCELFKLIFSGLPIKCEKGEPINYTGLYEDTRHAFGTGLCVGMSSTSLDYFTGGLTKPRPVDTFSLGFEESWPNVAVYHGRQRSKAYWDATGPEWQAWTSDANTSALVDEVYHDLEMALQPDSSDPVTVLLWPKANTSGKSGHAITPYRIDDTNPERPKVLVYENFDPGNPNFIQFDFSGSPYSFSYSFSDWMWNSANNALVLAPLSIWHSADAVVPYDGQTHVHSGGGEALISDNDGQVLGYVGGVLTATIPGAMPVFPWYTSDAQEPQELSYILPKGGYTATISGTTEPYTYTVWTTSTHMSVQADHGILGTQVESTGEGDQIRIGPSGTDISFQSSESPSRMLSFALAQSQPTLSKEYDVANVTMGLNGQLALGVTNDQDLYVRNSSHETAYDLNLQMVTTDTVASFFHRDIGIGATDIQTITVTDWQRMATVTLIIDLGGDGTVDETRILGNQLTIKVYLPLVIRND